MIGLMSMSVLAMLQYSIYQQRMTHRRVEREAVYYAAEAGVDQVVHYLNFPTEYPSGASLFAKDSFTDTYFDADANNVFSLRGIDSTGAEVAGSSASPLVFGLEAGDGVNRTQVTDLRISLPTADDLAFSDNAILVVHSQAENEAGQVRTVRATLTSEPPFVLRIPAPLISLGPGDSNGQFDIRWGEAWFKEDFELPNGGLNGVPTVLDDPWFNIRTEGTVLLSNGTPAPSGTDLIAGVDENYLQPWGPEGAPLDPDHLNIHQHATPGDIEFPEVLDYEFWKNAAQTRGMYFSWNDAGTHLVQGSAGAEIRPAEFLQMINGADDVVTGASGASQSLPGSIIVFVDTLDGNPPATDGSNLCDLTLTGGGETFLRGVIYVGGDVTMNVSGTQGIWIQDPDRVADPNAGSERQENLFMNGLFYAEGTVETMGSQAIYGAIFARGGFAGNGGPEIWYDARLANGLPFSFNSNVTVARVVELSPDIPIL
jgi:hypothetical protein